eukprot:1410628-Rhodomonas_salina.1
MVCKQGQDLHWHDHDAAYTCTKVPSGWYQHRVCIAGKLEVLIPQVLDIGEKEAMNSSPGSRVHVQESYLAVGQPSRTRKSCVCAGVVPGVRSYGSRQKGTFREMSYGLS